MHKKAFPMLLACLCVFFTACNSSSQTLTETKAPQVTDTAVSLSPADPVGTVVPVISPESETGRQNGERFEEVIMLEGMEETVRYEHVRNDMIGFEIDYDYEQFERRIESDCERFVSIWDVPENPDNYLDVTCSAEDAETVAASVSELLSQEYDLLKGSRELDRAGSCIWIEASELKGTGQMADLLQVVYIIPASEGCRVATAHFSVESAEGFGARFRNMMNTFVVITSEAVHH